MDPYPAPIRATFDDLPPEAARAIRAARPLPEGGARRSIETAGLRFSAIEWGPPDGRPLLLLHGVTSSARAFWRLGPGFAALGWHVVALDLPGHGRTGNAAAGGRFRFADTASQVAAAARVAFGSAGDPADADPPTSEADQLTGRVAVVGHSWGAMVAASLPATGWRPARIVLLDPPVLERDALEAMVAEPDSSEQPVYADALALVATLYPEWHEGDQVAKAEAVTQLSRQAVVAVLLGNGDWDAGLAALAHPAATNVPVWIVRGEEETGGLTPSAWLPALAERVGAAHILTVAGGPHSPQRTHLEATTVAICRALHRDALDVALDVAPSRAPDA